MVLLVFQYWSFLFVFLCLWLSWGMAICTISTRISWSCRLKLCRLPVSSLYCRSRPSGSLGEPTHKIPYICMATAGNCQEKISRKDRFCSCRKTILRRNGYHSFSSGGSCSLWYRLTPLFGIRSPNTPFFRVLWCLQGREHGLIFLLESKGTWQSNNYLC